MANGISVYTRWEVREDGSDTLNSGGFVPQVTTLGSGMLADLACTSGTTGTASCIVTSTSAPFAASDVGAQLFIAKGTSWKPGWYPILYYNDPGTLTIDTRAGEWVAFSPYEDCLTTDGCGSAASLTDGTFCIDYSQQASAQVTWSAGTLSVTGTILTDSASAFSPKYVGNVFAIGTTYVSCTGYKSPAELICTTGGTSAFNTNGFMGGAMGSIGYLAGEIMSANNTIWIKSGNYSITTSAVNVSNGRFVPSNSNINMHGVQLIGYGNHRNDNGTKPVITAQPNLGVNLNLIQGTYASGAKGWSHGLVRNIKFVGNRSTNTDIFCIVGTTFSTSVEYCEFYGFGCGGYTSASYFLCYSEDCYAGFMGAFCKYCFAYNCHYGFINDYVSSRYNVTTGTRDSCLAHSCTGGFYGPVSNGNASQPSDVYSSCGAYNCIWYGFNIAASYSTSVSFVPISSIACAWCWAYGTTSGKGFKAHSGGDVVGLFYCAGGSNTGGNYDSSMIPMGGFTTLTRDPLVDATIKNYEPSMDPLAGCELRIQTDLTQWLPQINTILYRDLGPAQHKDLKQSAVLFNITTR